MPKKSKTHLKSDEKNYYLAWFGLILAIGLALTSLWHFWGFVQDDTYISLRYARNLVQGHGLVFNPGEHVEGYSNFLWTVLGAGFLEIGLNPVSSLSFTGCASALALLVTLFFLASTVRGAAKPVWDIAPVILLAGSSTLGLWSVSGLEQTFFTLCGWAGVLLVLIGRPRWAGLVLLLGMLTRPEGVLFFLFAVYLAAHPDRFELVPKRMTFLKVTAIVAGIFLLYCGWRFWYFGDLLPNTYYVKGGGGFVNAKQGLISFQRLCGFNLNGVMLCLAPFALIPPKRRQLTLALLFFLVGYCVYEIKIGGDILPMFRLHMTVLPLQYLLAARALEGISDLCLKVIRDEYLPQFKKALPVVMAVVIGAVCIDMVNYSWHHGEFSNVANALEKCHNDIGRYLQRTANKGDVVLAQDMGAIPWYAPDLVFVDTIGLVDRTVAHTQYEANYTPYIRYLLFPDPKARDRIFAMEDGLRAYLFSRDPRYVVINVNFNVDQYPSVMKAMKNREKAFFESAVGQNVFFNAINKAPEWEKYQLMRGWEYSTSHFLLLYERA